MKREIRQALMRGALPACVAFLVLPFAPQAVPGLIFFALIGTVLSLLDEALDGRGLEVTRALILTFAGMALYPIAALQAVYAFGVIAQGSLQGGLEALEGALRDHARPESVIFAASVGQAHAAVILATEVPSRLWVRTSLDEFVYVVLSAMLTGFAIALPMSAGLGVALVIGCGFILLTLTLCVPLYALTTTADRIEQALWRTSTPDESSLRELSSRPLR